MTAELRVGPFPGPVSVGGARVRLVDLPFRTLVELRVPTARNGDLVAGTTAVEAVLGVALPGPGAAVCPDGERWAAWLGPGWWLLDHPPEAGAELDAGLVRELRRCGTDLSAVEVSAGHAVLELSGPAAREVLAHGCAVDLHPRVFGPGRAARTMLAKAQVVIVQTDRRPTFRLYLRASFARYALAWLGEAMTEYTV